MLCENKVHHVHASSPNMSRPKQMGGFRATITPITGVAQKSMFKLRKPIGISVKPRGMRKKASHMRERRTLAEVTSGYSPNVLTQGPGG